MLKNFFKCFCFQEGDKEEESCILLSSNNEDKTEISGTIHDINSSLILEAPQVFSTFFSHLNSCYYKEDKSVFLLSWQNRYKLNSLPL